MIRGVACNAPPTSWLPPPSARSIRHSWRSRECAPSHEHVTGIADDGQPYAANDPHLLQWVHIVEVDSFLAANRRHGASALTDAEADRYVAQMAVIAGELGVLDPPRSVAGAATPDPYRTDPSCGATPEDA